MFEEINNNIIKILDIDKLPVNERKANESELMPIVYQNIIVRILDNMSEEDKNSFENFIKEHKDPESMFSFLSEKVPNISQIATEEANKIRSSGINI